MNDVTAVLLTTGEGYTQRALESINRQTLLPCKTMVVREVEPFHRALNAGASMVCSRFLLQVDADMILDPGCLRSLRRCMDDDIGLVVGLVRDVLVGPTSGVKLYRTDCLQQIPFQDSISPDTDFIDEIFSAGWKTIFALQGRDSSLGHTFAEHAPDYTPHYTFQKYLRLGRRCVYRNRVRGFLWQLRQLQRTSHPAAVWALIGLSHGVFLSDDKDITALRRGEAEFEFLQGFSSRAGDDLNTLRVLNALLSLSSRQIFHRSYRLGVVVHRQGCWKGLQRALTVLARNGKHPYDWVAVTGLCRGLFQDSYRAEAAEQAFSMLGGFLEEYNLRNLLASRYFALRGKVISALPF